MNTSDYFKIDKALQEAWERRERRFNAYSVASWSGIEHSIDEINKYLLSKIEIMLDVRIEFLCPNNHPTASIQFGEQLPDVAQCHVCGEEFIPTLEDSNIVFSFKEEKQSLVVIGKKKVLVC